MYLYLLYTGSGGRLEEPWALNLQTSLGEGLFVSQVSLILLQFLRCFCFSFPDAIQNLMERSDETGATLGQAA